MIGPPRSAIGTTWWPFLFGARFVLSWCTGCAMALAGSRFDR
jgi:hypothetical protein